jgi:flagellar basal-body rod modification protein FlgD
MYINPLTAGSALAHAAGTGTSGSASNPAQNLDNMFLQLLTTQLKDQSPINPVDPNQFTSQLVEFNMLDQLTQINQTLQQIAGTAGATGSNQPVQGAR